MGAASEYRYQRLTWPEMNDAIAMRKVVILPTGTIEQHGPHLPLDVDVFLAESVCLEVGRRAADRVLVLPPVPFDLNRHHIDFPGTIHVEPEAFLQFCLCVTKSVAYQFRQHLSLRPLQRLLGTLDESRRSWGSDPCHGREGKGHLGGRRIAPH
ncbi:MAG: creatininase family protein [Pirellulales bacterium]|nr:creatininase family protein [Pirellulales bacterium]